MDNASNVFNYSVGGIAVGSTAISAGIWVKSCLPDNRMKELDEVLLNTRQEYQKSDAEGLLPHDFKVTVETKLTSLEGSRDELKERAYKAISLLEQVVAFVQGLSSQITYLAARVKVLRAQVVTKSEESRRLRDGRSTTTLLHVQHLRSDIPRPDETSHRGETTHGINPTALSSGADSSCEQSLSRPTNQPALSEAQRPFRSIAADDREPDTPQSGQFSSSILSRLWSWSNSPHQPRNDLESGVGSTAVLPSYPSPCPPAA